MQKWSYIHLDGNGMQNYAVLAAKIGEGCGHEQLQNLDVDGRRPEKWHWLVFGSDTRWMG